MSGGFYKTYRKIFQNEYLNDHKRFFIFHQILQSASHKKTTHMGVDLNPGEFTTSYRAFAERCLTSISSTRTALNGFKKRTMIDITPGSHHIKITVINWEKYQSVTQETHNIRTKPAQKLHLSRNKNKEYKNNKQTAAKKLVPACDFFKCDDLNSWVGKLPDSTKKRWLEYGDMELLEEMSLQAKEWTEINGKTMKNYAQFLENWWKRDNRFEKILQNRVIKQTFAKYM